MDSSPKFDVSMELRMIQGSHLPGTCITILVDVGDAASEYLMLICRHQQVYPEYYKAAMNGKSDVPGFEQREAERVQIHDAYIKFLEEVAANDRFCQYVTCMMITVTGPVMDRTAHIQELLGDRVQLTHDDYQKVQKIYGRNPQKVDEFLRSMGVRVTDVKFSGTQWQYGVLQTTEEVQRTRTMLNSRFHAEVLEGAITMRLHNWSFGLRFLNTTNVHKWPSIRQQMEKTI